ncbi:putative bifunctional diguanylate cyclase/phosphodiesterase [Sulfurihydrogenibium subterraneum]|uniref:putative bifunctional diguanylate cyclase/phosphodiesterase n=1 Tax=Sulfurihydrogenibium subterraneum TaxID=171121 RepID=UPI0006842C80|nr:GGDEF and EAL domain-containing protein [Sulfurihydrogenibium subterraneum]
MKLKESKFCFRINYFVENVLKVRSFATKITLMFLTLFTISTLISFGILSYYHIKEGYEDTKKHIDLATTIRQNLSQQKLEIFTEKIEKMLRNNLISEVKSDPKIRIFNEIDESINKPFRYYYENGIIYYFAKFKEKYYLIGIDEKMLYDIIMSKAGIVSIYNPVFYISKTLPTDEICSSKKYDNADFYLVGCIKNETVLKMTLVKVFKDSIIFSTSFVFILLISFFAVRRIVLFPLIFLTYKLEEINEKGLEKVKFSLQHFGSDELAGVSSLLEDFRKNIVKSNHKFKLIFETVTKMISISNNFSKFAHYTLNRIDRILNLEGSVLISVSKFSKNDILYSENAEKKEILIDVNQVIEKLNNEEKFLEIYNNKFILYIKKKVDDDLSLIFVGFSKEKLKEEDIQYLDVILSNFVYTINIYNLATLDFLTKIPNRRKLMMDLEKEISRAKRFNRPLSIALIDIDDFKIINDSFGHDAGDLVLLHMVDILKNSIRSTDIIGRYGGEEFLVIMPETSLDGSLKASEKIRKNIEQSSLVINDDTKISLTVSIGIANTNLHGYDFQLLLKAADLGLYKAKKEGKNRVEFLTKDEIENLISSEFESKNILVSAIKEDRIVPFFQPIIKSDTLEVVGYEVLARIYIPEEEKYLPAYKFITEAIRYKVLEKIDKIVQEKAIRYISEKNKKNILIFFNMSKEFFEKISNLDDLSLLLNYYHIKPKNIFLEVTEEEALSDLTTLKDYIRYGKTLGFNFAIDDFGAGYSNFIYLKHFPIDLVKLDGSLISDIDKDIDDQVIIESIIKITKHKNIKVLAEMVEKKEEYEILKKLGVDYLQGYYFGKPTPYID